MIESQITDHIPIAQIARQLAIHQAKVLGCTLNDRDEAIDTTGVVRAWYIGFERIGSDLQIHWKLAGSIKRVAISVVMDI